MGRQVNFYMMPEDLAEFEDALSARGNIVFLAEPMPGPSLREVEGLDRLEGDFGGRALARRQDLERIQTVVVPSTGMMMLKASESPVVELSRSRFDDATGKLTSGRLWFMTPGRGDVGFDPGEDFLSWADSILAHIRKNKKYTMMKDPDHKGIYISDRVREWQERGGVLGP